MPDNHEQVSKGMHILRGALAPYIARELQNEHGSDWWKKAVMGELSDDQKRDLPKSGDQNKLVDSLDPARCLTLFDRHWQWVFRKKLAVDHRTWAKELMGVRNKLAHLGGEDFSGDDTWRALDTMSRLCEPIDSEAAEEIRGLARAFRYGSADGSTAAMEAQVALVGNKPKSGGALKDPPLSGLPSWRDVITPHPDVAQGRYRNAEFAANLAQVASGKGEPEYRDPVEFFARTFVTEGMAGLLKQALRRVCGKGGEPVIQLKTAFGGGKTHSLLALYHLMRGRVSIDKIPNAKKVLQDAGVQTPPKANVAVLVGFMMDPNKSRRPQNMPGISINTIWGEMAAQIAESAGNPKLYDIVKESDKNGVAPGSKALTELFDAAAPCLVLMDELVAYAKKLHGAASRLPAGTYDNFIVFIQEVTEAARASKNSLVVASIPESGIEIGGEAGQKALETIEHTFGRMESIWKPVAANEGFEVVRRRLFLECKNTEGRDAVCTKFSQMYFENQGDFPLESREVEYRERMAGCYPIHPEVFDRLYNDWATLERFQRTRGVLRLMAAVIHELWMANDAGLMIMPGSIPLDAPNVRDELTRHLPEGWNGIVDHEVDGKRSIPYQKDQGNPRYGGKLAARRVARAIMLGSAPTSRLQNVRGIEASRIRLGVVQPGENVADFNDALGNLASALAYLYTNPSGDRYWYDTRPTLRKTVEDRATQVSDSDAEYEIETRLRALGKDKHKDLPFAAVHICPPSSLDVPDDQCARLVVLRPNDEYSKSSQENCAAMKAAADILDNRGTSPRIYRNTLAFLAPDKDPMASLKQAARLYLAWKSVKNDSEDLNLDATQNRETANNLERSDKTVDARIREAYCWLLAPSIDKTADLKTLQWNPTHISGGDDNIVAKAAKRMVQHGVLIDKWAPAPLLMELDGLLWKDSDHIAIKQLWEYLCTYCYLPRLAYEAVLEKAIRTGLTSSEYFAFASGIDGSRYIDLKFNQHVGDVERSGYLVKVSAAKKQIADDEAKRQAEAAAKHPGADHGDPTNECLPYPQGDPEASLDTVREGSMPVQPVPPKYRHFSMSADLDTTRINRDVQKYVEEVIQHLTSVSGAKINVSLEVEAEAADGFTQQTVRTISENCRTLRVRAFGFDE